MIRLESLVKRFTLGDETITAVNHANLHVEQGEFLAITGPSGSGKSTLMNIIGLLDTADEGKYTLDGIDVTDLSDDRQAEIRNEKIGFIFQSFYLLQKHTALENVMVPLLYRGVGEKEAKAEAEKMLSLMKMGDRMKHMPNQLSGGQQQRVAIARALVGKPALILADEPTGALDSRTGGELMELLEELNGEGQTIIMITHDEHVASRAKRIVRIEDGTLREEGAV
ncbi:MAG: ABC transporter ATP-binding protein [Clostridiales bacterium]|nr:ABC transporter ATP-binding protein [Clostridiales bacterium]MDD7034850.1 ABC transporter ATP-binding protein [Bacillota bacterium]MDY2920426.1 ABC transporter ATP-binding protein [Lentihominibacter sp.]